MSDRGDLLASEAQSLAIAITYNSILTRRIDDAQPFAARNLPKNTTIATSTNSSPQKDDSPPLDRCSPTYNSSSVSSQDRTESPSGTSPKTSAPDPPTRQLTPAFEPYASSLTPPQVTADGCGAPTTRRGLRCKRAHDEIPDPMWNSSRKIDLSKLLPTPAPPPLCAPPPIYADGGLAAGRSKTSDATASQASPTTTVAGKK